MTLKAKQTFRIVVLVSGRGSNLQAIIDAINAGKLKSQIVGVISNVPKVFALERAEKHKIPTLTLSSKGLANKVYFEELAAAVQMWQPNLIVLAGFMKIVNSDFISLFKNRIINIHPSLLPSFPGLHAQKQALDYGAKITGCTVHFVDEGCDTGPIILQRALDVLPDDDEESLSQRLLQVEHLTLTDAISLLENNKVILQGRKTLLRESL